VSAPGAVLQAEGFNIIPQFCQGCRSGSACQAGTNDNNIILPFVGRVDKLAFETVAVPFFCQGAAWDFCVKYHGSILCSKRNCFSGQKIFCTVVCFIINALEQKTPGNKGHYRDENKNSAHQDAEGQGPFEQQLVVFVMV